MTQYKVVIAGCGLSGMITAFAFAAHGIKPLILENKDTRSEAFCNDIRTTAITDSSRNFLKKIGIWQYINDLISPINDIYVVDNRSPDMIHFSNEHISSNNKMGYIIENRRFKERLLLRLQQNKMIDLQDKVEYKLIENHEDRCCLSVNNQDIYTDLLVLCSGNRSPIVQKYFSNDREKYYSQYAMTFIVRHDKEHEGTAVEHFLPTGPFASLPLKDKYLSSVVWSMEDNFYKVITQLPDEELLYSVQKNFGDFLGNVEIVSDKASFKLKAAAVKNYFNHRIAVVADSAHIIHPLAGQGLNQGIKDIESLVGNIIKYGICKSGLTNYQKERKTDNEIMLEATDFFNSVFTNKSFLLKKARNIAFKAIDNKKTLKNFFIKYAIGER